MATSRTGTGKWKRVRTQALARAHAEGQEHCPTCGTFLDYDRGRQPNSAEPDHIIPHSLGGTDSLDNVIVTCRWCNQSRGNGRSKRVRAVPTRVQPETTVRW